MALQPDNAEKLLEAGFTLDYTLEGSTFYFEGEEWVIGGRLYPDGPSSTSPKIVKKGLWLPSVNDLSRWLFFRDFEVEMNIYRYYDDFCVKATARDQEGREYKAEGGSEDHALFKIIMQVLKSGNVPEWNTFSVEIID